MKKIKIIILSIVSIGLFYTMSSYVGYAEKENVGFNIQMISSEKQQNSEVSYFDLRMLPG